MKTLTAIRRFLADDRGTELVEYTLILAFVMFTIMGLANGYQTSIAGVTGVTNSNLASANAVVH